METGLHLLSVEEKGEHNFILSFLNIKCVVCCNFSDHEHTLIYFSCHQDPRHVDTALYEYTEVCLR